MTTAATRFGPRLQKAMGELGPLCAGIDPHPGLLAAWGLPDDVQGLRTFAFTAGEAFDGYAAAIKPQAALFERFGAQGMVVLEELVQQLRASATPSQVILDAKRGDIGSTMTAYAQGYLANTSTFSADALTVSPYLGFESLRPAIDIGAENGNGLFVLALTSNPEGASVQHVGGAQGQSVAAQIVASAAQENSQHSDGWGDIGLVVGATIKDAAKKLGIDFTGLNGPILAPGIGAQGGTAADLRDVFGTGISQVLPSVSREVLQQGPSIKGLRQKISQTASQMQATLAG